MPKLAQQLSDTAARKARPKAAPYTLASGNGLHLLVLPSGVKQWLVRWRTEDGRRGKKVVGVYPDMTVATATKAAEDLHEVVRAGGKPEGLRDRAKARRQAQGLEATEAQRLAEEARANSFAVLALDWLKDRQTGWAPTTYKKAEFVIHTHMLPALAGMDMRTLASKDVVGFLGQMGRQTPALARNARQYLNQIVDYCIHNGVRGDDQVLRLRGVLPHYRAGHMPAITQIQGVGPLMRAMLGYGGVIVRAALLLTAYTACRPGVVAAAAWSEIDFERAEWFIPASKMKMHHDHIVSLPAQAVALLEEMRQYGSGGEYVFPGSQSNEHMHRDALSKALRDMGFRGKHTPHGYRALLRTVARERLGIDPDILEAQLAHGKTGPNGEAYDRTRFEDERRRVMQVWADFLHVQAGQKTVIEMRRA